jgi:hypothetical protein
MCESYAEETVYNAAVRMGVDGVAYCLEMFAVRIVVRTWR